MSAVVVMGSQWGDEGKGKIVDYLAQQAEAVVRYGGGSNAGHTVAVNGEEYKLRLLPSGILYKGTLCVIGNGVVVDPKVMLEEMDAMAARGIDVSGIRLSNRAHVVLPYHSLIDELSEELRGNSKIGTTKRGIGPCYQDKAKRVGIRVCDLMDKEEFAKRLKENLAVKNIELERMYNHAPLDYDTILKEYEGYAERLRPYVCDTIALLNDELAKGKKVLFEGAQATMLDVDYGTYPYVTSSHPVAGGIGIGAGVAPNKLQTVVGVVKAYCTRVGAGPFPTEQLNEIGEKLREAGHEFGTVTGRPRRTGWLDAFVVRYAGMLSGITHMAITRLDILDGFDEIKMCTGYKYKGELLNEIPASLKVLAEVEPVYETFKGWKTSISDIRKYEDLPKEARVYLERMAEVTGIKLGIVSVGPNRDQTIVLDEHIF
ncbi:adenylosuccinate synthase [Schwartzia succinivorans]|uniref:Adenylosuccinate synthetase n=1 Tax=Schwartzia succinivorans DSM 10502 TaxID=1123243 RepID=A0A1M4X8B7_9FIRM|nr:adenylosuccinate synthase [Schwartzia succinivorans]MBQ1918263.1 adenylosuccinate synthase [Schwartzia sp. (in: firmicutes)]MBE6097911.1 adenylosuccinate synthase [Schwartzia succinivorans]MBQ2047491.1 adenylosuccinate synthase [Schwartzia sp. (in: firmicutes)]MBQ3862645.1 adenylosuccinate synthase [Schwartzia sp. (in: firmicutes)]MBQ4152284.1 adenylosuccinate synthase [Schwartzia sp. (in: firmicutes)]